MDRFGETGELAQLGDPEARALGAALGLILPPCLKKEVGQGGQDEVFSSSEAG